jgi:hypothetical protein
MDCGKYEAIHYEIPPSLVLPTPHVQTFFSAPYSQTCSVRGSVPLKDQDIQPQKKKNK